MTHVERLTYIRIILGNITVDTLPDAVLDLFLSRWENYFKVDTNPDKEPLVLWNTCVSCLEWLIAKYTALGGDFDSRTEQIGDEKISVSGGSPMKAWKDLLHYITENPDYVDPSLKSCGLSIIVGGVRKSIVDNIKQNPDSHGWNKVQNVIDYTNNASGRNTSYAYHMRNYD